VTTRQSARGTTRRRETRDPERTTFEKARPAIFGAIVIAVIAVGGYLAFGDFLNRPAAAAGTIDLQSSMAGFSPSVIRVKAGSTVTLSWWTQDAAVHLQGGVHTMVAPALGLNEQLPAESRRAVTWRVPNTPGTYDVYCESCCGGKDSPTMHGKIVVESAA
jgi:plastocyanin